MPSREPTAGPALLASLTAAALALAACGPPEDPIGTGPVLTPQLFAPGVVSTPYEDEVAITFSPDAREAWFSRGGGGRGSPPRRIYVTRFEAGAWTPGELAPFSTDWDETPHMSADGSRLLFSSRRDMPGQGLAWRNANLWMVERTETGWSDPVPLPGRVNQPRLDNQRGSPERSEAGPLLLSDGTLLYGTDQEPDWGEDIYVADFEGEEFVDPRPLLLNSAGSERHPALSPDGRYLLFQAFRDVDAVGEEDLYVAERTEYGWSEPRPLPSPINSPDGDGYPSFSPDGRWFFFASERARDGTWSIYYVETRGLGLEGEAFGR